MKVKLPALAFICTFALSSLLFAQDSVKCDCQSAFDELTKKLEENYIGYALRKDEIGGAFRKHVNEFRALVNDTNTLECVATLQKFLSFFKDGHLFVSQFPKYSQAENDAFKASLRSRMYEVATLKTYLVTNRDSLSDIEGVWTDGGTRYAIVRNTNDNWHFQHVAVVLESPDSAKVGELKLGVDRIDGEYVGAYYSNAYSPRYVKLEPGKDNTLLNLWGGFLWGRVDFFDLASITSATLYNPTRPTLKHLNETTILLTIPTFLVEKPVLDTVLLGNADALTSCQNLIIDIRGNSGGNGIYFDLMSLYAEKPLVSETGFALASADNLEYFTRFAKNAASDPYYPVVDDMKKSMGEIVKGPRFSDSKLPTIASQIQKVVILTDKTNISACETFILYSKGTSSKVVTIGTNTGGVVDYNNINMIKITCDRLGIYFGYPTYTLNDHILKDGYNQTGISPDVFCDKRSADLIAFAMDYLKK